MSAFIDGHDVVMFDLDGVLYLGPDAVEGAVEGVNELVRRGVRPAQLERDLVQVRGGRAHPGDLGAQRARLRAGGQHHAAQLRNSG